MVSDSCGAEYDTAALRAQRPVVGRGRYLWCRVADRSTIQHGSNALERADTRARYWRCIGSYCAHAILRALYRGAFKHDQAAVRRYRGMEK